MIMNCPGVFFTPVSNYFGVPKAEFTLYFSIINITAMVYLPLCGKVMDRVDLRYFMSVAVLLAGVTYILMSSFTAIWMFYVARVVLGIALTPIMFLGTSLLMDRWCVKNVGLFIGIGVGAACGIAGLLIMWLAPLGFVAVVIGSFLFAGLYSYNAVRAPLGVRIALFWRAQFASNRVRDVVLCVRDRVLGRHR